MKAENVIKAKAGVTRVTVIVLGIDAIASLLLLLLPASWK